MTAVLTSFQAFMRSWVRPKTQLGRKIRSLLVFKLVVLVTLKLAFFSGGFQPAGTDVADRFTGSDPQGGRMIVHD
jgi:hypothetical protein